MFLPFDALGQFKMNASRSARNCKLHHHLRSEVIRREIGSNLDRELQLIRSQLINKRIDSERCRVLAVNAVVHDQEFTIWRLDGHSAHVLEVARIDTLVEVAVVEDDAPSCQVISGAANLQVIVQHEAEVGVPLQVGFHLDDTVDRRIDHQTISVEEDLKEWVKHLFRTYCQFLKYVYKDFI